MLTGPSIGPTLGGASPSDSMSTPGAKLLPICQAAIAATEAVLARTTPSVGRDDRR